MENQNSVSPAPQNSNRIWIIVGVVVLLCCCLAVLAAGAVFLLRGRSAVSSSIPSMSGGYSGRADDLLKSDTLNAIIQYEASQNNCNDVSLFSGNVMVAPQNSGDSWIETWQISACGESHLYAITFTPSPQGGTDFSVKRVDQ